MAPLLGSPLDHRDTDSPLCHGHHCSKQLVSGLFYPGTQITASWGSKMEDAGCTDPRAARCRQAIWPECGLGCRQTHILAPPSARKDFCTGGPSDSLTLSAWPLVRWPQWSRPSRALTLPGSPGRHHPADVPLEWHHHTAVASDAF